MSGEPVARSADVTVTADSDTAFYWDGTSQERLLAQRCGSCQRMWHPPGPVCPHCQCLEWSIDELSRQGTIYSVAKVHEPGSPIQGTHYLVALVEQADPQRPDESVRLACNIRGGDLSDCPIGAPVSLVFEPLAGDYRLPQFEVRK
ncbi:MAG: nucleic acid-binding protein [Acidimicrobiia bacterium]|nr:nucleic acid-binding protein [Acidimicrobiia bacterium]